MLRGRVIIQIADAENTISNSFVWTIKKERKILMQKCKWCSNIKSYVQGNEKSGF